MYYNIHNLIKFKLDKTLYHYDYFKCPPTDVDFYWRSDHYITIHGILEYLLLEKNVIVLHASSMHMDGDVVMNAGIGGSFKTSNSMKLYRQHWDYMSDGFSLVQEDGTVLAYPSPTFAYRVKCNKVNETLGLVDKALILKNVLTDKFDKCSIAPRGKLTLLNLNSRADRRGFEGPFLERLWQAEEIERKESRFIRPPLDLVKKKRILEGILKGVKTYYNVLPTDFYKN